MYNQRNLKDKTEELIKDKSKFELELIIIDLYYDNYDLNEELTKLRAKYE